MASADRILSVLAIILGSFVLAQSFGLQYTKDEMPGPGFAPFWVGLMLIGLAILIFISSFLGQAKTAASPFMREEMLKMAAVIGGSLLVAATSKFLGLLVSLGLLSGFLAWLYGSRKWQTIVLVAVLVPASFYLIFPLGLDVRLPRGILGI